MTTDASPAKIYEGTAQAVTLALFLFKRRQVVSESDRQILRDLENVQAGLAREAAHARGIELPFPVQRPHASEYYGSIRRAV